MVINCIAHVVHFIFVTHLFFNQKFVPLNLPHLFLFSPPTHSPPPPTQQPLGSSLQPRQFLKSDLFIPILYLEPVTPHQISSFQFFVLYFCIKILLIHENFFTFRFLSFVPFSRALVLAQSIRVSILLSFTGHAVCIQRCSCSPYTAMHST